MSRADDLVPLLTPPAASGDFRQGVVKAWDEATGTNTVVMGGTELNDLPCLTLGDFVLLQPGDVVLLARFGSTYFILGRVLLPSGVDRNRSTVDFASDGTFARNFSVSTTSTAKATVTIPVPAWADEAAIIGMGMATFHNDTTTPSFGYVKIGVTTGSFVTNGGETMAPFGASTDPSAGYAHVTSTATYTFARPTLGSSIVVSTMCSRDPIGGGTTWAADSINLAIISALAVFRRTD